MVTSVISASAAQPKNSVPAGVMPGNSPSLSGPLPGTTPYTPAEFFLPFQVSWDFAPILALSEDRSVYLH